MAKELISICKLYAITPVHAGSGAAIATVDLPIQREKHTSWPHVQASSVKGAFRDHFRKTFPDYLNHINQIFGSDKQDDYKGNESTASIVAFSDARLLAFPVRSDEAPYVHVTAPAVLKRLLNDLSFAGYQVEISIPALDEEKYKVMKGRVNRDVVLEDVMVRPDGNFEIKDQILSELFADTDILLLVSDTIYNYLVNSATEIQTQIKINHVTGTTETGSLRYQELLPQDSVLYILSVFGGDPESNELQADTVRKFIQQSVSKYIQIGGDYTLGRGICKVKWLDMNGVGGN